MSVVHRVIVCRTYGGPSHWHVTGLVVHEADVPHFYHFLQATADVPIEMNGLSKNKSQICPANLATSSRSNPENDFCEMFKEGEPTGGG